MEIINKPKCITCQKEVKAPFRLCFSCREATYCSKCVKCQYAIKKDFKYCWGCFEKRKREAAKCLFSSTNEIGSN